MKINSAHLKNFGKHKDRSFDFESGITVVRGGNETGKTTMVLGIMYALFGSAVLDFSLEYYVHLGEKSLKVTVLFTIDGKDYICVRGTAGAELTCGGEVVATNHGPVTAKVEELLGVPAGKAESTIFAKQNKIQGILSLGPTALSSFIEELAGFDQIDKLISDLGERLETGSTKPYEAMVEQKGAAIAALPDVVDVQVFEDSAAKLRSEKSSLQTRIAEMQVQAEANKTVEARRQALIKQIAEARRVAEARSRLEAEIVGAAGLPEKIVKIEQQLEQAKDWLTYSSFKELPTYSGDVWEGDLANLLAEIYDLESSSLEHKLAHAELQANILNKQKEQLTSTICPITKEVCGQLSDPTLIERTNAEIAGALVVMTEDAARLYQEIDRLRGECATLKSIQKQQATWEHQLAPYMLVVTVDRRIIPWEASWAGAVPPKAAVPTEDPQHLKLRLAAAERAQAQLDVLGEAVDASELEQDLANCKLADTSGLSLIQQQASDLDNQVRLIEQQVSAAKSTNFHRDETLKSLEMELAGLQASISAMQENNELLKAVKAARLVVANVLWGKVLGGTSRYFSMMRGEDSTITRSAKGFLVNDHPIVSGSTFDALGLALRVTMAKLFANCSILALDEAGAGMDATRTSQVLGTLASAGFSQVLYVTHRDSDESAGNQLMEV